MARTHGSNKYYKQALSSAAKLFKIEVLVDSAILDAVNTMIDISRDVGAPVAIRLGACKYIIEAHQKICKEHGKEIKSENYAELSTSYKPVKEVVEEEEDNVISLEFKEG
jgi:hypothetical protein